MAKTVTTSPALQQVNILPIIIRVQTVYHLLKINNNLKYLNYALKTFVALSVSQIQIIQ